MRFSLLFSVFVFCLTCKTAPLLQAEQPPNVVMLISDDQAWGDYGFMGHPDIQTPHIDKLASESTLFRRGYVPTALCRPSLMTFLTGHYASTHGVTGNDPSRLRTKRDSPEYKEQRAQLISYLDRFDSLPRALGKKGYLSHQSGKLWEGSFSQAGFTHGMTRGFPEKGGRHGDDGLKIGREGLGPIAEFVDHAVAEEKPFFVWYAAFLPHTPHNPPKRLLDKYAVGDRPLPIAKYYAMCEWWDETCGGVVDLLNKAGVADNTLIVYVCDNGWIQNPKANGYAPRSKQTPYEGGIRTPIFYHWPRKIPVADRPELETSLDIYPTILSFAGVDLPTQPAPLPGLDIRENLLKGTPIKRERIFGESFAHDIADIEKPEESLLFRWVIEGKWKLLLTYDGEIGHYHSTHPRAERRPQLFDLLADPAEETNLAGENPEVVARLVQQISDWYPVTEREVDVEY